MTTKVHQEWCEINAFLAAQKHESDIDMIYLGRLFKEYIEESVHGSWEGFSRSDLTGVRRLLTDLILYTKHAK